MTVWPYLPVWPILLLVSLCTLPLNHRSAIVFFAVIAAVKGVQVIGLQQEQAALLALYTIAAAVCFFFVDRVAGVFLAIIGVVFAAHIFGIIDHRPKVLAAEAVLVLGMVISGISGPSGGTLERDRAAVRSGYSYSLPWIQTMVGRSNRRD